MMRGGGAAGSGGQQRPVPPLRVGECDLDLGRPSLRRCIFFPFSSFHILTQQSTSLKCSLEVKSMGFGKTDWA